MDQNLYEETITKEKEGKDNQCAQAITPQIFTTGATQILYRFRFHPTVKRCLFPFLQLSTFTVNYVGHPFNNSISENKVMFNVLKWMSVFLIVVLFNLIPGQ
jgi:hypothetical protein